MLLNRGNERIRSTCHDARLCKACAVCVAANAVFAGVTLGVCRQLALFHNFGWLLETVEHILIADGQMDARREEAEEEEGQDEGEQEGDAMQEDQ